MTDVPKTRAEAREHGSRHYFTGRPCKQGHTALRRTADARCVECTRMYSNRYARRHREKYRQASRDWYRNNREHHRSRQHGHLRNQEE